MAAPLPDSLLKLLHAQEGEEREGAWEAFLGQFSRLVFLAARKSSSGYDDVMDRYTFILESLRADEFRRLRRFKAKGRSTFNTWFVVISSRLCVDYHRRRYGRFSGQRCDNPGAQARRRLVDLLGEEIEMATLQDVSNPAPDRQVQEEEVRAALKETLLELSNEERLLIRLRFEDQQPVREVARVLGWSSEFTARRRLKAVLKKLRGGLETRGIRGPVS